MDSQSFSPTMAEVARKAGVSQATVSRALAGNPRVKPETRQRIQGIAEELGFCPHPAVGYFMAQLRKRQKAKYKSALAIISPHSRQDSEKYPVQIKFIEGATSRANKLGYSVEYCQIDEAGVSVVRWKQILDARNIRGVLLTGFFLSEKLLSLFSPMWINRTCVMIGARSVNPAWHFAANDLFATSTLAVKELAKLGYRNPAYIHEPRLDTYLEGRFRAGFLGGNHGLKTSPDMILAADFLNYSTFDLSRLLSWIRQHRPDAIICGETRMVEWLGQGGIRVPEDIGVVRLDLHKEEQNWAGVYQNSDLVAKSAVDLLIGELHQGEFGPPPFQKCVLIEGRWVSGSTVRQQ